MGGYALTVRFELRNAESAAAFDQLLAQTLEGIRSEPGTLVYSVHVPVGEPLVRVFYELYADEAAFRAHEEQQHTQRMLAEREQYLAAAPAVMFLRETLAPLRSEKSAAGGGSDEQP
ncbi:putative quinol monooxygenase [Streptomyces sp. H27-C3]|uniref:putative quinol monooxygenase n=1 Tax=Streptomyces sp. H27-C3 TaxID=3046305 RepID=UPI0024B93E69|nr:putative quinol monooxygenase [Streptomyces sp. H27-C3]MDJ0465045.1 putative quinol monooxygenase [Streptomyces sp. H27-C3]